MNDRVFQTAFDALTKALIKGGHLPGFSLEERDEIAAALVDAISPALHKDLHERLDRQTQAIEWIRTIAGGGDRLPPEWGDPWRKRAEETEARLLQIESAQDPNNPYWRLRSDRHEATVARVKALAEDMRTWCSPHGIAVTYAQRIEEAIEPPAPVSTDAEYVAQIGAALRKYGASMNQDDYARLKANLGRSDIPAVRAFAANLDPREKRT